MASPSEQKGSTSCSSQHQERSTRDHALRSMRKIQGVDHFTYLGSSLSRAAIIDLCRVNNKIANASVTFGKLCHSVWQRKRVSLKTELKVYQAMVLSTLLYSCETWTVYSSDVKQLNRSANSSIANGRTKFQTLTSLNKLAILARQNQNRRSKSRSQTHHRT